MKKLNLEFTKTYATEANAEKAVQKWAENRNTEGLIYYIQPTLVDGKVRFGVLFVGQSALSAGVHFHWNVVA